MRLTKKEREGFLFLKKLSEAYLKGKVDKLDVNEKDFYNLEKLGITVERVNHNAVQCVKRGKEQHIARTITNAPWYIRGSKTKEYLPFQIKTLKPKKD